MFTVDHSGKVLIDGEIPLALQKQLSLWNMLLPQKRMCAALDYNNLQHVWRNVLSAALLSDHEFQVFQLSWKLSSQFVVLLKLRIWNFGDQFILPRLPDSVRVPRQSRTFRRSLAFAEDPRTAFVLHSPYKSIPVRLVLAAPQLKRDFLNRRETWQESAGVTSFAKTAFVMRSVIWRPVPA